MKKILFLSIFIIYSELSIKAQENERKTAWKEYFKGIYKPSNNSQIEISDEVRYEYEKKLKRKENRKQYFRYSYPANYRNYYSIPSWHYSYSIGIGIKYRNQINSIRSSYRYRIR